MTYRELPSEAYRNRIFGPERQQVKVYEDVDTERLYGHLDVAIQYLQELREKFPQASLDEHWTGYEDMSMVLTWTDLETDAELEIRLEREKQLEKERANREELQKQKEAARKTIAALKRKHGL